VGEFPPDDITRDLEWRMRRFLIIMRFLGWFWMLLLVLTTFASDAGANQTITAAAMLLATVWTGVTWWAAQEQARVQSIGFLLSDGVVCLAIGWASYAANAADLFHGGYPISWLVVLAYGRGMGVALIGSLLLVVQQTYGLLTHGRGPVSAVGSIVFILYAVIFGWLFGMIRDSDKDRRATVAKLTAEREENARRVERLELANKLHDSALQTLQVIEADAEDSERVRKLARRQTRELRNLVDAYASADVMSLRAALVKVASDIEDLFDVDVSAVIRAEVDMDPTLDALVEAAREAMTNAAKYSGAGRIDLYAALEDGCVAIYVRDEGRGFDVHDAPEGHGLEHSIRGRIKDIGGEVHIESKLGEGTEVKVAAVPQGVLS
jgi:signal transduction histidine kinase